MLDDNEQLCDTVFGLITDHRPNGFPVCDYSTAEQTVVLVWHFTGIIGNAGLGGLFGRDIPGDPDYLLFRDAFARLGCEPVERAIDNAFAIFPDKVPPTDVMKRREIWAQVDPDTEHELSNDFWDASEAIPHALAEYIRRMQIQGELPVHSNVADEGVGQ